LSSVVIRYYVITCEGTPEPSLPFSPLFAMSALMWKTQLTSPSTFPSFASLAILSLSPIVPRSLEEASVLLFFDSRFALLRRVLLEPIPFTYHRRSSFRFAKPSFPCVHSSCLRAPLCKNFPEAFDEAAARFII